jgi:hypothetical protein
MNSKILSSICLILLLLASSCTENLVPFNRDMQKRFNLADKDKLGQVQFYLSRDVILERDVTEGSSEVITGKIKIVQGRKIEQIIIPARTPGVLVRMPQSDRIGIGFENNDKLFLMFGPNPKRNDNYTLFAKNWKKTFGTVTYDGKEYSTSVTSGGAELLVDMRLINKQDVSSRTAKGRRISQ